MNKLKLKKEPARPTVKVRGQSFPIVWSKWGEIPPPPTGWLKAPGGIKGPGCSLPVYSVEIPKAQVKLFAALWAELVGNEGILSARELLKALEVRGITARDVKPSSRKGTELTDPVLRAGVLEFLHRLQLPLITRAKNSEDPEAGGGYMIARSREQAEAAVKSLQDRAQAIEEAAEGMRSGLGWWRLSGAEQSKKYKKLEEK